jgi:hypothetical protein
MDRLRWQILQQSSYDGEPSGVSRRVQPRTRRLTPLGSPFGHLTGPPNRSPPTVSTFFFDFLWRLAGGSGNFDDISGDKATSPYPVGLPTFHPCLFDCWFSVEEAFVVSGTSTNPLSSAIDRGSSPVPARRPRGIRFGRS